MSVKKKGQYVDTTGRVAIEACNKAVNQLVKYCDVSFSLNQYSFHLPEMSALSCLCYFASLIPRIKQAFDTVLHPWLCCVFLHNISQ